MAEAGSPILLAAGITLIVLMVLDVCWTVLAVAAGRGPLSWALSRALWRIAAAIRRRRVAQVTGYVILVATLFMWVATLWAGLFLLFMSDHEAVLDSVTSVPAGWLARAAFALGSIAGAGAGYIAGKPVWELVNNIGAVLGLGLVAMAASHLVSVSSAAVGSRRGALQISALGLDAVTVVAGCARVDHGDLGRLPDLLTSIAGTVATTARQHLALPELRFLQTADREAAFLPNLAVLDDVVTLLEAGLESPADRATTAPLRAAIDHFVAHSRAVHTEVEIPPVPPLWPLREVGLATVDDDDFAATVANRDDDRRVLAALLDENGWEWPAADGRTEVAGRVRRSEPAG